MAPLANVDELIAALEKATSSTAAANACRYVLQGPQAAGYVDVWLEFQRLVPGPPPFQDPECAETEEPSGDGDLVTLAISIGRTGGHA